MKSKCIICKSPSIPGSYVFCPRCGNYSINAILKHQIEVTDSNGHPMIPANKIHLLSSTIKSRNNLESPYEVRREDIDNAPNLRDPSVQDKSENILNYIASKSKHAGDVFKILYAEKYDLNKEIVDNDELLDLLGSCFIKNQAELSFILEEYLTSEKGYLIENEKEFDQQKHHEFIISPAGWAYHDEINKNQNGQLGFIAMSFDPKFDELHDIIYKAITDTGWKPLSLKKYAHNENIYNEIIFGIKRSKFVIADFTDNCNGAYYEAGFAKGLGLDVIHIVRDDYISNLHFDTKQIFHLQWKETQLETGEFYKNIKIHILATIGNGPYFNG